MSKGGDRRRAELTDGRILPHGLKPWRLPAPVSVSDSGLQATVPTGGRKPHLFELDRLRIITAVSVVMVHTLTYTAFLDTTALANLTQNGFLTAFHFTREIFIFITALALVYVYAGKPLDAKRFWQKRAIGVLIPYIVWSLIYQITNTHTFSPLPFLGTFLYNIVTGSASFQLYYILLTLEFYALFPWFLGILPRLVKRPWLTLAVSAALELALMTAINYGIPLLHLAPNVNSTVGLIFDRFAPVYQLYFVMGALAGYYLPQVRAWLTRWGMWTIPAALIGMLILEANYLYETLALRQKPNLSVAVLQPTMIPFSVAIIALLYWLCLRFAQRNAARPHPERAQKIQKVWGVLSDSAFGVYLVHPLFLIGLFILRITPYLKNWPTALVVVIFWLGSAACSIVLTLILLQIPVVSRLMGRERPAPEWLRAGWERLGVVLSGGQRKSEAPYETN